MKKITSFQVDCSWSKDKLLYVARTMLFLMVLFASSLYAQDPPQYGTPYTGVPNRMDANIYQLNFREYTPQRTIVAAKNNMQRLKDLGINVIYLMPFTSVTTDATKGMDRSPYSIKDLKGVDPELGTLQDIRDYVAQAHTLGMAVIYDFVPNQTAWDHPWITQHPDWYAKNLDGTIRSPDAGAPGSPFLFMDVAELDLTKPIVVNTIIDAARYWIFAANFDGIRLDWADKAGQAFNNTFVSNMRSITSHTLLLLAEGSNEGSTSGCNTCGDNQPGAHWAQGWDYIYGTNFYWIVMKKVWKSGEPAKNLNDITNVSVNGASFGEYGSGTFTGSPNSTQLVARFLSSHDNYNEDGSPFIGNGNAALGGRNAVMSAFAVIAYHRGVPFIYNGLDVGNINPLPYPWRTGTINWTQDPTVYTEMQKMLSVRNSSVALRRGQPTSYIDPANTNPDIIAFTKINGADKAVVLVNVRNSTKTFTIPAGMSGVYYNAFVAGGSAVTLNTGSVVTLTPYQYLVYTNANVPIVAVTGVVVNPTTATVGIGSTQQLNATIIPANATNQSVTWTSSNTAVASVNAAGLVTGVAAGTSTITATTADGNKTATSAITVAAISVTGVSVSPASATLFAGSTQQLTATVAPANATNKTVTWSSNNTAVATVNASGLVTAVAAGTANITVTTQNGSKTAVAAITVNANSSFTVHFYKPTAWGTAIKIYWWSALPTGVLADASWPGVNMTNSGNGWYSYTFTNVTSTNLIFNDGTTQTADLNRNKTGWYMNNTWYDTNPGTPIAVTGITITPTIATLNVSGTQQVTPTVAPTNASNKTVTYSTSNASVATVNSTGLITAIASGSATITATTQDGNKTATCAVTVNTASGGTYYTIKNRWKGTYLYDAGANVGYGATVANNSYKWQKNAIDATYFLLKNVATGEIMHIENQTGSVQANGTDSTWWSAQWSSDNVDGTWIRIRNRWQTGSIVHVENQTGFAQYANAQDIWHSAQWRLEVITGKSGAEKISIDEENATISIYPNPSVNNEFNITLPELKLGDVATVTITDLNGRKALVTKVNASSTINHTLPSGLYLVTISSDGVNVTKKLIVK